MFNNVGNRLKVAAWAVFIIGAVLSLFTAIMCFVLAGQLNNAYNALGSLYGGYSGSSGLGTPFVFIGIFALLFGGVISYVCALIVNGYGRIVDNTDVLAGRATIASQDQAASQEAASINQVFKKAQGAAVGVAQGVKQGVAQASAPQQPQQPQQPQYVPPQYVQPQAPAQPQYVQPQAPAQPQYVQPQPPVQPQPVAPAPAPESVKAAEPAPEPEITIAEPEVIAPEEPAVAPEAVEEIIAESVPEEPPVAEEAPAQPAVKFCGQCGAPNDPEFAFCIKCGSKLD